jgi:hypothetical protein
MCGISFRVTSSLSIHLCTLHSLTCTCACTVCTSQGFKYKPHYSFLILAFSHTDRSGTSVKHRHVPTAASAEKNQSAHYRLVSTFIFCLRLLLLSMCVRALFFTRERAHGQRKTCFCCTMFVALVQIRLPLVSWVAAGPAADWLEMAVPLNAGSWAAPDWSQDPQPFRGCGESGLGAWDVNTIKARGAVALCRRVAATVKC